MTISKEKKIKSHNSHNLVICPGTFAKTGGSTLGSIGARAGGIPVGQSSHQLGRPGHRSVPNGTDLEGQIISHSPRQNFPPLSHPPTSCLALAKVASSPALPFRGAPVTSCRRWLPSPLLAACPPGWRGPNCLTRQLLGVRNERQSPLPEHHTTTQSEPHTDTFCACRLPDVGFLPGCPELHHARAIPHHDRGQHRDLEGQGRRQVLRR